MIRDFEHKFKQIISVTSTLIAFDFSILEALNLKYTNQHVLRH